MSQGPIPEHGSKSFMALVGTQFFGAFNDNLFKQLILFLAARFLFKGQDMQGLAFMVFALPFVLFSGIAGDLSERFSKRNIIVKMKLFEIVVMGLGLVALQMKSWNFMLLVLFIMGVQSAFFGPSKYGVIPELVPPDRLMKANGTIAMTTFMAVLLGQALAGPLLDNFKDQLWVTGAVSIFFAVVGTVLAVMMGPLAQQNPTLKIKPNPFGSLFKTIGTLRKQEGIFKIVMLNSVFWFNAGVIQQSITALGEKPYLNVPSDQNWKLSVLMVTLAIAIIIGSIVAPMFSKRLSAGGITTLGVVGMLLGQGLVLLIGPVFTADTTAFQFAIGTMAIIGFSGAFFVVPMQSYLQHAPPPGMKGRTFAVNNFMNFLFLVLGGAYYLGTRNFMKLSPTLSQFLAGVIMLVVFLIFYKRVKTMEVKEDE